MQVLTRALGQAVPHDVEGCMVARLAVDDALIRWMSKPSASAYLTKDLDVYFRDQQEKHFIQQEDGEDVYLCGQATSISAM